LIVACIPAFNEEKAIAKVILQMWKYVERVVVCDDGSSDLTGEMAVRHGVHLTNTETVQLAREAKASILLADEEEVRGLAAGFGLEVRGCLGLLAEAVRRELISVKEAKQDAKRLIEEGYRISEEVLKEFYIMLRSEESK